MAAGPAAGRSPGRRCPADADLTTAWQCPALADRQVIVRPRAAGTAPGAPAWPALCRARRKGSVIRRARVTSAGIAVTGVPAATPGHGHDMLPAPRVDRFVDRVTGNPSATGAASAILRVIGAASALSAWRRGYGKEKVYGSIP